MVDSMEKVAADCTGKPFDQIQWKLDLMIKLLGSDIPFPKGTKANGCYCSCVHGVIFPFPAQRK